MERGAKQCLEAWRGSAAYGYLLSLDSISLAWEYLRRNPAYLEAWRRRRDRVAGAPAWSLKALEDPAFDSRDAVPLWQPLPPATVCLTGCTAPGADTAPFSLWGLPVHTRFVHDGH